MANKLTRAWGTALKFTMRFGRGPSQYMVIIGGGRPLNLADYKAVEEALANSAAVATVSWIQRNYSEAPLAVGRLDTNDLVKVVNSRMVRLMKKPNDFYSGLTMMKAVIGDLCFTGNGYIIKQRSSAEGGRNGRGAIKSLWWVPSYMMEPIENKNNNRVFIDHYDYTVNGTPERVDVEDVIHFRDGFDPDDPRKGMSKFRSVLRELCTDNEANMWTWALLKNMGVPGIVITPGKDTEIAKEDADQMKDDFASRFTGPSRGMPLITSAPVEVKTLAFNAEEMNLTGTRHLAEERITAVIGLPAVVVGLGAGLAHSTFANFAEAREAAYESCMIPFLQEQADVLSQQLLPEFHNEDTHEVFYDISKVRVLQPDINAQHVRVRGNLLSGLITLNQALIESGYQPIGPDGDVRYIPNGVSVIRNEDLIVQLPAPMTPPTDTGDNEDDIEGNPEGGAPTRDEVAASIPLEQILEKVSISTNGHGH